MKHIFTLSATLLMVLALASPGRAMTVFCANCSEMLTQQIERVTNLEQLKQLMSSYHEAIEQTQQQIALVQSSIQQYQNMLKNTLNLPANLLNQVKGEFSRLAQLTSQLNTLKGDVLAMGEVFNDLYPNLDLIKNMAGGRSDVSVKEIWTKWSKETDRAAQAAFQVTGSQLKDLAENSEALDSHIAGLLGTPEGQMQAIQSGNSLAALQIKELRDLRLMMATNIQAATQAQMKDEKREQLSVEQREFLLDESGLESQYRGYK
ncbi:MAG: P-type conjugative transfer protein TrbJ [Candidatus Adiutrix sp.]|jgi:P-type conjugative transfer protein TrbJ|nr:P-type conjugative transfer protein TrbJ [Candidatus Adiutrix sp.]